MVSNKIILQADCKFEDTELREIFTQLITKVETLNERTKRQTIQIRELQNENRRRNKIQDKELNCK